MTTGITTIVDQLTGRSRIPASAQPRDPQPAPQIETPNALDRVLPLLDRWTSRHEIARALDIDHRHAGRTLERGVGRGVIESLDQGWKQPRLYRRVR